MSEAAELLLAALVPEDPITHSYEGLDDACMWCGADSQSTASGQMNPVVHDDGCVWIAAADYCGIRKTEPTPVDPTQPYLRRYPHHLTESEAR